MKKKAMIVIIYLFQICLLLSGEKSKADKFENIYKGIEQLLQDNNQIRLVIVTEGIVKNTKYVMTHKNILEEFEEKKHYGNQDIEQELIEKYGANKLFAIISRNNVDDLLSEIEIQSIGIVNKETALKIDSQLGANYLLALSRELIYFGDNDLEANGIYRLVDLDNLKIIAVGSIYGRFYPNNVGNKYSIDGRKITIDSDGKYYFEE